MTGREDVWERRRAGPVKGYHGSLVSEPGRADALRQAGMQFLHCLARTACLHAQYQHLQASQAAKAPSENLHQNNFLSMHALQCWGCMPARLPWRQKSAPVH